VDFLDITLDLEKNIFKLYRKPGDRQVIKNIPKGIERRLMKNFCNEEVFQTTRLSLIEVDIAVICPTGYMWPQQFSQEKGEVEESHGSIPLTVPRSGQIKVSK
jgi:hypothetical protein